MGSVNKSCHKSQNGLFPWNLKVKVTINMIKCTLPWNPQKSFTRIRRVVFFTLSRNAHFLRGCSDEQNTRSENRLKTDWTKSMLRLIVYRLLRTTFNLFVLDRNTRGILDVLIDAFATHSYHNNESRWMYIVLLLLKFTIIVLDEEIFSLNLT